MKLKFEISICILIFLEFMPLSHLPIPIFQNGHTHTHTHTSANVSGKYGGNNNGQNNKLS